MASQQLSRRENTTDEREIQVEKDKVPKMTTHFEHLAEKEKDFSATTPPPGSIDELQCGEHRREYAGKAIGDIGGPGKARETHELGTHFQCLADSGRTANLAGSKGIEERRETEQWGGDGISGGVHAPTAVRNVNMQAEGERGSEEASRNRPSGDELEARTRLVSGSEGGEERGRRMDNIERAGEEKGRVTVSRAETEGVTTEQKERGRERENRDQGSGKKTEEDNRVRESYIAIEKALQGKDVAAQAKDAPTERGQKGYLPAKDTISSVARTAVGYTAPVAEKAKDYTIKTKAMAKSAGSATASYIGEKAGQAKDVTVESGKNSAGKAGKVAVDLKDKATAAGWGAAHYSVEKTVEGTKAAAHAIEGAAGYAGHKATETAAKSLGAVKGLAAQAGETVVGYTAKKKEETQNELETKRATHRQISLPGTRMNEGEMTYKGEEEKQSGLGRQQQQQHHEGQEKGGIGQTIGQLAEKIKPCDTESQQRGQEHRQERGELGIGQSEDNYGRRQQEGNGNGVLEAIKETLVEIAETTKNLILGDEDQAKVRQKMGSERGNLQGYSKSDEYGH